MFSILLHDAKEQFYVPQFTFCRELDIIVTNPLRWFSHPILIGGFARDENLKGYPGASVEKV
jgi:hypothetical protein